MPFHYPGVRAQAATSQSFLLQGKSLLTRQVDSIPKRSLNLSGCFCLASSYYLGMFRVLIVEDDQMLMQQLKRLLEHAYSLTCASTLSEAYAQLEKKLFDIAVVDRVLPDGDGLELVTSLHDDSPGTKTLVLTHKSAIEDRIAGLQEGADEYLPKPFSADELLLRLQHLASIQHMETSEWQTVGTLMYKRSTGEVFDDGISKHLRPRELQILDCLARHRNQVVTRRTLISHIWGSTAEPSETTLDVYLRRLRMLLGNSAKNIQTVRGFGYVLRDPGAVQK